MKLEQQVVSLELAQKLKELGVKQESLYYWLWNRDYEQSFELCNWFDDQRSPVAAFTVAELGEMLPPHFVSVLTDFGGFRSWSESNTIKAESFEADTEADARAKMLIYLLENNIINS